MPKLQEVTIWDKNAPENKLHMNGRVYGPWLIINRGRHMQWGLYDAATGYRIVYTLPTLKTAERLVERIEELKLTPNLAIGYDAPVWGDGKSYDIESVKALSQYCGAFMKNLAMGQA